MNHSDQIDGAVQSLREQTEIAWATHGMPEGLGEVIDDVMARLVTISAELDAGLTETDGNFEGATLTRLSSFPYPHADDRDRMQLSLFERPAAGPGDVGEFIIWTECREHDHDGYREAARHNGFYFGYVGLEEREAAYFKAMKLFAFRTGRMISPFCREDDVLPRRGPA